MQIVGRNGTGKSSILEAIRFVFAKDARRYRRRIRNGMRSCAVKLVFSVKGNEYLVERKLYLNRSSDAQMLVNSEIVASNPTEVYNRLRDILSENVLDKLLYVPQDGLVELINNLRIKGGRQELDSLLGLDRFERVYEGIKAELNSSEARFDVVSNSVMKYPEDAGEVFDKQIDELDKETISLEKNRKTAEGDLSRLRSQIKKLEDEINRMQRVKRERDGAEKKISDLQLNIVGCRKEIEFLNQRLCVVEEKKGRYATLSSEIKKLEGYPLIKEILSDLMKNEERLVDLNNIGGKEKELRAMEEELASKEKMEGECKTIEAEVVKLERELAAKKQSLSEREDYLKSLAGLEGNVKCPRCGQKLTLDHIEGERKISLDEIEGISKLIKDLERKLLGCKVELDRISPKIDRLKKAEVKAGCLRDEIEQGGRDKDKIVSGIKRLKEKLTDLGYQDEPMKLVDSRVAGLYNIRGEISGLQEEIGREGEYKHKSGSIQNSLQGFLAEEKKAGEKLGRLVFDETIYDALQHDKDNLVKDSYEVQNNINKCDLRMEHCHNEITGIKNRREEFAGLKKMESDLMKEICLLKDARDIFHTNKGIVRYLRERYILHLSSQITHYFKRINQNPKYREIAFDKEYNMEIKTTDGSLSIDQLSGGERVQLALALRIALIRLISPVNLLILDEPFGSLDREHREVLGEALNKIASDGQLILVTHIVVDSLNLSGRLELDGY